MTAFTIKLIAITAMLADHLAVAFPDIFPYAFRYFGRLTFPLLAYLIAEGCRHTRSILKFMLRLFIFAIISEIPFDLVFYDGQINFFSDTNTFYTLFLGVTAIYVYKESNLPFSLAAVVGLTGLAIWLKADYGVYGVAFIFTMYVIKQKKPRLITMAFFCCLIYSNVIIGLLGIGTVSQHSVLFFLSCLLTVPVIGCYNGRRGLEMKWLFYLFYPAHLVVIIAVLHILDISS
jgi:hypothetical protein